MPRIFINYRRKDSIAYAGRIYDHLASHFGPDNIFMDIDNMQPGVDFREVLYRSIPCCNVFLALIGMDWATARDDAGRPRLSDPNDFVVLEIEMALKKREILVVPLLINGARIPSPSELPARISALPTRHALEVRDQGFRQSMTTLIDRIERFDAEPPPAQSASEARTNEAPEQPHSSRQSEGDESPALWTLPEELYLLCADGETGNSDLGDDHIAMAVLAELVLKDRLSLESNETARVRDRTPTGDPIVDRALDHIGGIVTREGSSSVSVWHALGLSNCSVVQEHLRRKGVLERKEQSSWVFFTKTRYSVTSASLQNAVRLQFARALEGAVNLTDRTAVLAAIASSSGVPQGIPASLWRLANTKAQAHEFGSAIMTLILAKRERERSSGAYSGWAD